MERGEAEVGGGRSITVSLIPYIQISRKTDINDALSLFHHAVFTQLLLLIKTSLFFFVFFFSDSVFCFYLTEL